MIFGWTLNPRLKAKGIANMTVSSRPMADGTFYVQFKTDVSSIANIDIDV